MSSFTSKRAQKCCRDQSKSIKLVTSCAGHVHGIKKLIDINSSLLIRFRQKVNGLVQLVMQNT